MSVLSINPENSNVSVQLMNPAYDAFYRALATSIFAKHTGFNLGFGCHQYNPPPAEELVIGYHNYVNHKIQVGLAKWLRMYIGGFALSPNPKQFSFSDNYEDGDFSEVRNDGKFIPSLNALLNFFGEMYSAMLTADFGKIHLPEDLTLKFNEFVQPPMSKMSWVQHTKTWDDSTTFKKTNEFLNNFTRKSLVMYIPDSNCAEKISFNFFNSMSLYNGMIPPPPDIDKYHEKSGSVNIKLPWNIKISYNGNGSSSNDDILKNSHCLLETRHNLGGKVYSGYHVIFPVIYNQVNMERRRRYRDITKELVKNLPKTLQSKIMINYADIEVLDRSSGSVRGTSSGTSSSGSVRGTSSGTSSLGSVRETSSGTSSSGSVRGTSYGINSSSSSGSGINSSSGSVRKPTSSNAFSDDDNDGEDDSVEKKKSMDNLVKDAFIKGNQKSNSTSNNSYTDKPVYKLKTTYSSEEGEEMDDNEAMSISSKRKNINNANPGPGPVSVSKEFKSPCSFKNSVSDDSPDE